MAALLPYLTKIAAAFPSATGDAGYLTSFSTDVSGANLQVRPWATVDTLANNSTFSNDIVTNTQADRALWYRTTTGDDSNDGLGAPDRIRYGKNRPLYMYVSTNTIIKEFATKHIQEDVPCIRITTAGVASAESCRVAAPNSIIGSGTDTLISLNSNYSFANSTNSAGSPVLSEMSICTRNKGTGSNLGVDINFGDRAIDVYKYNTPPSVTASSAACRTVANLPTTITRFLGTSTSVGLIDIPSSQVYPAGYFDRDRIIEPTGNETVVVKTMPNAIAVGTVVSISGGGGTGGVGIPTVSGGVVTGIALGSGGTGYALAPPAFTTYAATPIVPGGSGYTSAPTVSIIGTGTGATAIANIDPGTGRITGFTVTSGGSGYSNPVGDVTITLKADNPRTVFILKLPVNTMIGRPVSLPIATTTAINQDLDDGIGVKIRLDGVSANNVFWVVGDRFDGNNVDGDLTFAEPSNRSTASAAIPTHRTVLVGTFIGYGNFPRSYSGALPVTTDPELGNYTNGIGKNVEIRNGRFLGFTGSPMITRVVLAPESPAFNPAGVAFGLRPAEAYIPYFTRSQRFTTSPGGSTSGTVSQINNVPPSTSPPLVPNNYQVLFQEKDAAIVSMTTDDEPLAVPVLQINAPTATTVDSNTLTDTGTVNFAGNWSGRAVGTEVNAYFVSGNSPSRSNAAYTPVSPPFNPFAVQTPTLTAENGGGLPNFIRYMENWVDAAGVRMVSTIKGGFIQSRRSLYATAPFAATAPYRDLTAVPIVTSSDMQSVFARASGNTATTGIVQKYYKSSTGQAVPYFFPPLRQWGYDVGLLTQTPDLFAERFSKPATNPNEFFREVDRQDPYIKSLLCAYQPATSTLNNTIRKGGNITIYQEPALPLSQRPTDCAPTPPTPTPVPTATP